MELTLQERYELATRQLETSLDECDKYAADLQRMREQNIGPATPAYVEAREKHQQAIDRYLAAFDVFNAMDGQLVVGSNPWH